METKKRVIFLCKANSIRSLMAQGFMRKYAGDRFEAYSAGIFPKSTHPLAIEVMAEAGINIDDHKSNGITEILDYGPFDFIFTTCKTSAQYCPNRLLYQGQHIKWYFDNPDAYEGGYEEKIERFRQVRDQIEAQVKDWLEENP